MIQDSVLAVLIVGYFLVGMTIAWSQVPKWDGQSTVWKIIMWLMFFVVWPGILLHTFQHRNDKREF